MSKTTFFRRGWYKVSSYHDTGNGSATVTTRQPTTKLLEAVHLHIIECQAVFVYNLTAVFEHDGTTEIRVIADNEDDEVSITHLAMVNVGGVGCN